MTQENEPKSDLNKLNILNISLEKITTISPPYPDYFYDRAMKRSKEIKERIDSHI